MTRNAVKIKLFASELKSIKVFSLDSTLVFIIQTNPKYHNISENYSSLVKFFIFIQLRTVRLL